MTIVSQAKREALKQRMAALGIEESQIIERFIKGSGSGGQKLNKTSSCVYLLHQPTAIEVKCQVSRSQSANRFFARRELCERIEALVLGDAAPRQQVIDKIRRQKKRRARRSHSKAAASD